MKFVRVLVNLFHFNRTNWKAVALCFFAAAVFWLFHALNQPYSTHVDLPLTIRYDPTRFVPVQNLPDVVTAQVNGSGWDLIRILFYKKNPVEISIDRPLEQKKLSGTSLLPLVASAIEPLKVNYVVTDSLLIPLDARDRYRFRLAVDLKDVSFREGYGRIGAVVIEPATVELEGARSRLHQLPDSLLLRPRGSRLNADFDERIDLVFDRLTPKPAYARIRFAVGPVREGLWPVVPYLIVRKGQEAKLLSPVTAVAARWPAAWGDDFVPAAAQLRLDCRTLAPGVHRIFPSIVQMPKEVSVVLLDSLTVEVHHP